MDRAEGDLRLLRSLHLRLSETPTAATPPSSCCVRVLDRRGLNPDAALPDGFLDTIHSATTSASKIRDRFSVDGWMRFADIAKTAKRLAPRLESGDDAARAAGMLLRKVSGFTGLVHENMYRFIGWRFMSIGRSLERVQFMLSVLHDLADRDAPEGALDLAVELGDSAMTHRRPLCRGHAPRDGHRPAGARSAEPAIRAVQRQRNPRACRLSDRRRQLWPDRPAGPRGAARCNPASAC